jgi:two-component system, OmpR family, phosphate regulon sensor histidine kinase PhoR
MFQRLVYFLLASCLGWLIAVGALSLDWAPWGALAGAAVALAWDSWGANGFDKALRSAQAGQDFPVLTGWWGARFDRVRRIVRSHHELLAASERRMTEFLTAIQASPNGVLLLDAQNRIEWCNQTAAAQLGLDAQRDVQQHVGNLVRQPDFASYLNEAQFDHEVVFAAVNSTAQRPIKISVQLHPYGVGRKLMLTRDVTAIEQAEAQRRDFVANVSHEIRTPLTVVSGFIETLQNLPLDESQRTRYLGLMAQQSQRMQALVSDLLTLSKLEGSPAPSLVDSVPIRVLLEQCEQDARSLLQVGIAAHALPLRLHFRYAADADDQAILLGASSELLSAMGNLVNNAVRYTPAGGTVDVRWAVLRDGRGELRVTDTGPGIAPEHLPRLTERFYRVDRSRSRDTGGTGLGLAIAKHVAQRHGGELRVESIVGQGSTFTLTFSAARVRTG